MAEQRNRLNNQTYKGTFKVLFFPTVRPFRFKGKRLNIAESPTGLILTVVNGSCFAGGGGINVTTAGKKEFQLNYPAIQKIEDAEGKLLWLNRDLFVSQLEILFRLVNLAGSTNGVYTEFDLHDHSALLAKMLFPEDLAKQNAFIDGAMNCFADLFKARGRRQRQKIYDIEQGFLTAVSRD